MFETISMVFTTIVIVGLVCRVMWIIAIDGLSISVINLMHRTFGFFDNEYAEGYKWADICKARDEYRKAIGKF